jgi:tetratricopeptide (TPR) repeat protein
VSCLLAVIIMVPAHGQSDKAVAHANRAIQLMDQGLGRQAIAEWDKAIALEPGIAAYQYERTLCYVMEKDYVTALSMLTPIYRDSNLYDRGYQLMGNIYSLQNDSAQAVNYYREGIAAVPTSGRLHYEIGAAAFIDRKIPEALDWWKRGTRVEPGFATNYYWLAKVYAESKEKLWSVLYGEAFLNLERASERTKEVSKLLFDTWNAALRFGDTLDPINLASEDVLEIPSPLGPNQMNFAMAFEFTVDNISSPHQECSRSFRFLNWLTFGRGSSRPGRKGARTRPTGMTYWPFRPRSLRPVGSRNTSTGCIPTAIKKR